MNRRVQRGQQEATDINGETSVRPKRVPVGMRPRLPVEGKDPNYTYRWVNDIPGRISSLQAVDWQLVPVGEVNTNNHRVDSTSSMGQFICDVVNGGDGMKAYLMKIHKDLYQQDMDAYEDDLQTKEEGLRPSNSDGQYGKISISRGQ